MKKAIIMAEGNLDPLLFSLDRLLHLDLNGLGFILRELGSVFDEPEDVSGNICDLCRRRYLWQNR